MLHNVSVIEEICRAFLREALPDEEVQYNKRLGWLLIFNPITDTRTVREIDIYFPKLRIAVEVSGGTHFHNSVRRVDNKKRALCRKNDVAFYEVWSIEDLAELRKTLFKQMPHKVRLGNSATLTNRMESYRLVVEARNRKVPTEVWMDRVNKKERELAVKVARDKKNNRPQRHHGHLQAVNRHLLRKKRERAFSRDDESLD